MSNLPQALPLRIVSLVPSLTELLCDLGLREQIVGCTKFCVHPETLRQEVDVVGGTKQVHVERVRALEPTHVIVSKEENVREQVEAIAEFAEIMVTDICTLADANAAIHALGVRFDASRRAEEVIARNAATLTRLRQPQRGSALYLIWREPYMAAGGDTYIHAMLEALGYSNVLSQQQRYPSLSVQDMIRLSPKHLLLSSEPYPFRQNHLQELQELLPKSQVGLVDGELYSWYGSRLGHLGQAAKLTH